MSDSVVPGALVVGAFGLIERSEPSCAPPLTHRATRLSSAGVRMRCCWFRYAGESWAGIQGGIWRACVIFRISGANCFALLPLVSENGAIPPVRWQPAHLEAKSGATLSHVTRSGNRGAGAGGVAAALPGVAFGSADEWTA